MTSSKLSKYKSLECFQHGSTIIRSCLHCLLPYRRCRRPDQRRPFKPSRLEMLPNELLQYTASLLDTPSAASLALCSRRILYVIGTQYWSLIKEWRHGATKWFFLVILQRDLPAHRLCHRCIVLHLRKSEGINPPTPWSSHRVFCADRDDFVEGPYSQCIAHQQAQLAMNYHRLGPAYGISLDRFDQGPDRFFGYIDQSISQRARIVANHFLIRWQIIKYTGPSPLTIKNEDTADRSIRSLLCHVPSLCPHRSNDKTNLDAVSQAVRCMVSHADGSRGACQCAELKQCDFCHTEFMVELEDWNDEKGTVVVVTAWADLGSIENVNDPKWQSHLGGNWNDVKNVNRPITFPPGSIRAAFISGDVAPESVP